MTFFLIYFTIPPLPVSLLFLRSFFVNAPSFLSISWELICTNERMNGEQDLRLCLWSVPGNKCLSNGISYVSYFPSSVIVCQEIRRDSINIPSLKIKSWQTIKKIIHERDEKYKMLLKFLKFFFFQLVLCWRYFSYLHCLSLLG